jgi:hypothetical protein
VIIGVHIHIAVYSNAVRCVHIILAHIHIRITFSVKFAV